MTVPQIEQDQLLDVPAARALLIDVRSTQEYEEGHVPGAQLAPLEQLLTQLAELPRERPVWLICASGARSTRAAEIMRAAGIDACNVAGGTTAWREAGRPLELGSEGGSQ